MCLTLSALAVLVHSATQPQPFLWSLPTDSTINCCKMHPTLSHTIKNGADSSQERALSWDQTACLIVRVSAANSLPYTIHFNTEQQHWGWAKMLLNIVVGAERVNKNGIYIRKTHHRYANNEYFATHTVVNSVSKQRTTL